MMVRLYDYDVPAADPDAGVPSLRPLLDSLDSGERRTLLTGLFKPERMPGTMERLTTLVEDIDTSFANALVTLDNATRSRRFVAIDEAKAILDRWLPDAAIAGSRAMPSPSSARHGTSRSTIGPSSASVPACSVYEPPGPPVTTGGGV